MLFVSLDNLQELEVLTDPVRKELATMQKKVDAVNRELRSLGISCQKKVTPLIS